MTNYHPSPAIGQTIRTVVFDLDGTLYDKRGLARRMMHRLWWCLPLLAAERMARRTMAGREYLSEQAFYNAFFAQMAKGHWWTPRMAGYWYHHVYLPAMIRLIGQYHHPRPETMAMLDECRERRLTVALFSDYGCAPDKLRALQIDPSRFSLVADAPSLGALKPAETAVRQLLTLLQADPHTTLFVGDRDDKDGASARAVGAHFLLI